MNRDTEEHIQEDDQSVGSLRQIYMLTVASGLIVLAILCYGFYKSSYMSSKYLPLIDAVMEIKNEVTVGHLWLEEILSGDRTYASEDVLQHLDKAQWYIHAMLNGDSNAHGKYVPLDNHLVRQKMKSISHKLTQLIALTEERVHMRETSVAGSEIDQRYDRLFSEFIIKMDQVEDELKLLRLAESQRYHYIQVLLVVFCMMLFVFIGVIYWRVIRDRSMNLQVLHNAKKDLEEEVLERSEAKEEVQIQNDELQKRLLEIAELRDLDEERLVELNLANEQLRIAIDESEAANRDKSEFFAGMAHEIRIPTNAIIDLTYLTLDTQLGTEQRENISTIKESSYAILSMLDSFMDILKIEAGNLELNQTEFNIQNMLDSIIMTLSPQAQKKNVDLTCQIDDNVALNVKGDKGRLWQILIHLVGNAIKFTADGDIKIGVRRVYFGSSGKGAKKTQGDQSILLQFSVSDTGIGISEEHLSGIFENYSHSGSHVIREFGETRLGLHISNKLVHMMGGEIWVESEKDVGSSFHFTALFDGAASSVNQNQLSHDTESGGDPDRDGHVGYDNSQGHMDGINC